MNGDRGACVCVGGTTPCAIRTAPGSTWTVTALATTVAAMTALLIGNGERM
jgi:hypothetical protein